VLNRIITTLGNVFIMFWGLKGSKMGSFEQFRSNSEAKTTFSISLIWFKYIWFISIFIMKFLNRITHTWFLSLCHSGLFLTLWIDSRISDSYQILTSTDFPLFTCPNWIRLLLNGITTLFLPRILLISLFQYKYSNTNARIKVDRMKVIKELVSNTSYLRISVEAWYD